MCESANGCGIRRIFPRFLFQYQPAVELRKEAL
jgi:hypothetical protein